MVAGIEGISSRPHSGASRDTMFADYTAAALAAAAQSAPLQSAAAVPYQPLHNIPLGPLSGPQANLGPLLPPVSAPTAQQILQFSQAFTLWQTLVAQSQPQGPGAGQGPLQTPSLTQLGHLSQLQQPLLMPLQYQLHSQGIF